MIIERPRRCIDRKRLGVQTPGCILMRAEDVILMRAEDLRACEKWLASASVGSKTAPPNGRRRHVHPQKLRSGETDCCKLVWDSALPLLRPERHHRIHSARPTGGETDAAGDQQQGRRPGISWSRTFTAYKKS